MQSCFRDVGSVSLSRHSCNSFCGSFIFNRTAMHSTTNTKSICNSDEESDLRRGPWTLEEDNLLMNYVSCHGEGRWNLLAKCSGLKRTGKSCRLRWLNYLKPDVKRGNLSPEEQFKILELHSKWGNRWSKIAQHLPGRTDNEIKNYWRTRVQKQARQLKNDSNSESLLDSFPYFWMPTSLHNVDQDGSPISYSTQNSTNPYPLPTQDPLSSSSPSPMFGAYHANESFSLPSSSSASPSPYDLQPPQLPEVFENPPSPYAFGGNMFCSPFLNSNYAVGSGSSYEVEENCPAYTAMAGPDSQMGEEDWAGGNDIEDSGSLWNMGEMWQFRRPE